MKKKIIAAIIAGVVLVDAAISTLMFAFAGQEPIATYNLADLMREAYASEDFAVSSTLASNKFGPYHFKLMRGNNYDTLRETTGTTLATDSTKKFMDVWNGQYGSPGIAVDMSKTDWDGFGLRAQDTAYTNWMITAVFTAPRTGVYDFVPKVAKNDASAYTNSYDGAIYSLTIKGEAQLMDGTNTELQIAKNGSGELPTISGISLKAGDTIELSIKKPKASATSWGRTYVVANYDINLMQADYSLEDERVTFNAGDEMRKKFAESTALSSVIEDNAFGNFKFSMTYREGKETAKFVDSNVAVDGDYWSAKCSVYTNPAILTSITDQLCPGYAIKKQGYGQYSLMAEFTAPTDGTYRIVPRDCYAGKSGSVYNTNPGDVYITIEVNGVKQEMDGSSTELLVKQGELKNIPTIEDIELKKGDTILVTMDTRGPATNNWVRYNTYINYDIDLVETEDRNFYFAGASLANAKASAGSEFYINLSAAELMQTVSGAAVTVKYDTNIFEFVKAENMAGVDNCEVVNLATGEVNVMLVSSENNIGNFELVRLYFKVKDAAVATDYTIEPTSCRYLRINEKDPTQIDEIEFKNFVGTNATITVE